MDKTLGIDEAGRGPVIGPMVIAGCVTTPELDIELAAVGVKDSKMITPKKRELLFEIIKKKVVHHIVVLTPEDIDNREKSGLNLNQLEAVTGIKIMAEIQKKSDCRSVIFDSPSNNPAAFTQYIHSFLKESWHIRSEIKADRNHICVSAASILAKVTRDRIIDELQSTLQKKLGAPVQIGSGYPSDPITVAFLQKYWNSVPFMPGGIFRKTWASYMNVAQKSIHDY